jgi:ATP-dependent helicase/nuclease subunit A
MSLGAGDESNAVVEALDAVNLMTVHASKGLEFPIVFVVNLAKGASGPPRPVRVIAAAGGSGGMHTGDSVSVGPFISETDELERERERHETRRLLYVALTRGRDRLYLASTLKDGALVPGRGSLAEVLPDSLRRFLAHALTILPGVDVVGWSGQSGHEYVWRLCRQGRAVPSAAGAAEVAADEGQAARTDDFGPPAHAAAPVRVAAGELAGDLLEPGLSGPTRSDRLLGLIVHRLFESARVVTGPIDGAAAAGLVMRLLRPEERAVLGDPDAFVERAVDAWLRAESRADVRAAFEGARRAHEVPFSLVSDENGRRQVVRGTIDCLVTRSDGRVSVVELKTGRPSAAHERQLDVYVRAARRIFPGVEVDGVLLYL